ncbi:MAG: ECF transporter S component [Sporolactobacillus sp.]|nr:ECF transporter S component [Sporolactobacillus sp.]
MRSQRSRIFRLAFISVFTAIIIVQNFVPFLGYIPLGAFDVTLIHITVIIVAIVLGPLDGAIIGGIWGGITLYRAFAFPTSPIAQYIFTNPLVSVVPRILIGVFAGYAYRLLRKTRLPDVGAMSLSAIIGSLTNTVLVLGMTYLLYSGTYAKFMNIPPDSWTVLWFILGIVATNGIPEAIAACLIAPAVAKPLMKLRSR